MQNVNLATEAGIFAVIAATFSVAVGTIGVVNYLSYVDYYVSLGYDAALFIGFLVFGAFAFISSIFGFAGGLLALKGKRLKISVIGILVMLASALFTLVAV
jgi:hypothetical protein